MKKQKRKTGGGVIVAIGLLILSKLKWVLAVLKFSKFGGTIISMVISLGIYVAIFGWRFAVALIYLMFVHEMGHLVAAKQKGIKTSPAIFIPFLGAAIGMKEKPKDAATEAYLAYGGPLAGLISIFPAIILYNFTHQPIWALVIMLGALLNLFNLVPVSPLDGGRIVGVLSPHLWLLGLIGMGIYTYFYPSGILILIIILGVFSWWHRIREDFMIKTIQAEISVKVELIAQIEKYKKDLFYTYYDEAENDGPPVNETMLYFVKREWHNKLVEVAEKVGHTKSWFFPFIEDKAKLEKRRMLMYAHGLEVWIQRLDQMSEPDDLAMMIEGDRKSIHDLEQQIEKINKYFDATPKTRIIVFLAYIALAAILVFFYIYGNNILNSLYWGQVPPLGIS